MTETFMSKKKQVEAWSIERGLDKASPQKQVLKLIEEMGEYTSGVARGDRDLIIDSLGDALVVTIILAQQLGIGEEGSFWGVRDAETDRHLKDMALIDSLVVQYYILDALAALTEQLRLGSEGVFLVRALKDVYTIIGALCEIHGETEEVCLAYAYEEIKDRKGKMVDGVFVKEEDLT